MTDRDNEDLGQLAATIYSLPKDRRLQLSELLGSYGVEPAQARQLSLLPEIDEGDMRQKGRATKGKYHPNNKLNDLAGNEWVYFTKTVLRTSYPSELGHDLRKQHYANKPPALMQEIIEFFTKRGQTVLDPFAGVGGTLLGASLCGRKAVGIELERRWLDIYRKVCSQEHIEPQETICGDCLEVMPRMVEEGRLFDAIVTDPPYSPALEKTMCDGKYGWSSRESPFESFSSSPRDFRNSATFDDFYDRMEEVGRWFFRLLKPRRYAVVMIRDSYQDGQYIPVSFYVAERFRKLGFEFKGVKIWYQTGAPVRPYGYPYAFVPNIVHHNILVFRKPKG
ncbi:MAG: DNA methyltransferase [Anaerolineae bacterium]